MSHHKQPNTDWQKARLCHILMLPQQCCLLLTNGAEGCVMVMEDSTCVT
jgi:hypothetical protein